MATKFRGHLNWKLKSSVSKLPLFCNTEAEYFNWKNKCLLAEAKLGSLFTAEAAHFTSESPQPFVLLISYKSRDGVTWHQSETTSREGGVHTIKSLLSHISHTLWNEAPQTVVQDQMSNDKVSWTCNNGGGGGHSSQIWDPSCSWKVSFGGSSVKKLA